MALRAAVVAGRRQRAEIADVALDELPKLPVTLPPVGGRVVHQAQRAMEEEMR